MLQCVVGKLQEKRNAFMSSTLNTLETASEVASGFAPQAPIGLGAQLRIRIGERKDRMLARFDEFVLQNPDLVVEQDSTGEIVITAPAGAEGSSKNSEIAYQLTAWSRQNGGWSFDSSALFILPRGAKRSPDAAWIEANRWESMAVEERRGFPRIAPDFVIELRSETDRLPTLKNKMQEYIDNGVRLAWLIDPIQKQVHIYQPNKPVELLDNPTTVFGGDVLVGFTLELSRIF
jgi:Uma2 family endonuclease